MIIRIKFRVGEFVGFGVLGSRKETVYMISKKCTNGMLSKLVANTEEHPDFKLQLSYRVGIFVNNSSESDDGGADQLPIPTKRHTSSSSRLIAM